MDNQGFNPQVISTQAKNQGLSPEVTQSSATEVKEQLSDILNSWEFKRYEQDDTLQELIMWLLSWLGFTEKDTGNFNLGQWTIYLVLIVIGLILIIYLVRNIAPFWRIMTPDIALGEKEGDVGVPLVPLSLSRKAQEMAQLQEFREALRYLYLALLIELDEKRVISYQNAKTNHEYLREVNSKARSIAKDFGEMMDLFEHKWYGLEECTQEDYHLGLTLYHAITKEGA